MKDLEKMFTILTSQNRDIFMGGDFNFNDMKTLPIFQQDLICTNSFISQLE